MDDDNVGEKKTISQGQVVLISTLLFALGLTFEFLIINSLISNIFYALTMGLAGFKTFRSAWFGIKAKSLDMNVLMSIASIGAVLIGQWSEGATVLYLFVIGIYLQNKAVDRTRQSIKEMMSLAPDNAILYKNGEWIEAESKSINVGDTILVRSGDKIALDGIIEKGNTNINQSSITGESIPVSKKLVILYMLEVLMNLEPLKLEQQKLPPIQRFLKLLKWLRKLKREKHQVKHL
ncbi:hypothetical protein OBG91_01315 [Lactococcus lactis]|nr:hypothetical protein [Lactococcus lactis]